MFSKSYDIHRLYRPTQEVNRVLPHRDHKIYGIKRLHELLGEALRRPDWESDKGVRFVVREDYKILFALEGGRGRIVPGHADMAEPVLAAGKLCFDKTGTVITGITHKSGAFRPSFDSLIWLYALLVNRELINHITLADVISIERLDGGGGVETSYKVPLEELQPQLAEYFNESLTSSIQEANRQLPELIHNQAEAPGASVVGLASLSGVRLRLAWDEVEPTTTAASSFHVFGEADSQSSNDRDSPPILSRVVGIRRGAEELGLSPASASSPSHDYLSRRARRTLGELLTSASENSRPPAPRARLDTDNWSRFFNASPTTVEEETGSSAALYPPL